MTARLLLIAWMIIAGVAAAILTIEFTGVLPVHTVNHCPTSDQFVCPSTHIRAFPMLIYMAFAIGLFTPAMAIYVGLRRRPRRGRRHRGRL